MTIHVLCFGNLLQGDDGFGIHVYRRLCTEALPPGVRVFDAGIAGLSALAHFDGCERAVVVDALADFGGGNEGRVHRLTLTELAPPVAAFSAHALDLAHVFHALPILFAERSLPEIVIIGAEIKKVTGQFSMDLSPRLAKAVKPAVRLIRQELAR